MANTKDTEEKPPAGGLATKQQHRSPIPPITTGDEQKSPLLYAETRVSAILHRTATQIAQDIPVSTVVLPLGQHRAP